MIENMETSKSEDFVTMETLEIQMGKNIRSVGLEFENGRKLMLLGFERGYIIRLINPDNAPDDGVQVHLSKEAMSALINLYAYGFADATPIDHSELFEKLTATDRDKLTQLQGEVKEILENEFDN